MIERLEGVVLDEGDRVLIVTRRLFPGDIQRHFVGTVDRGSNSAVRVHGHAFIRDAAHGGFVRRKGQRTRVFPLDNTLIVFVLPDDVDIEEVKYDHPKPNQLVVTDGKHFNIDISELGG